MMRSKHVLESLAAAAMIAALSACAGGGGGGGGGDVLGGNVSVPGTPQYSDGGTKLADAPDGTEFPLLQTQGYYSNSGGKVEGEPGDRKASITPLADGMRLKVENFLNVEFRDDAHRSVDGDVVTYTKNVEGRQVVLQLYGALVEDLDYMELGAWAVSDDPTDATVGFGVGVGGYETHPSAMPTSGSATYEGTMVGVSVEADGDAYDLVGQASMTANFGPGGSGSVTGEFRSTTATEVGGSGGLSWNDVDFTGSIASNGFSGGTDAIGANSNPGGLGDDATGTIVGKFFGPGADEAGGTWTLRDAAGTEATGAFGGVKQP